MQMFKSVCQYKVLMCVGSLVWARDLWRLALFIHFKTSDFSSKALIREKIVYTVKFCYSRPKINKVSPKMKIKLWYYKCVKFFMLKIMKICLYMIKYVVPLKSISVGFHCKFEGKKKHLSAQTSSSRTCNLASVFY